MARMECRECGAVSAAPINCARCGGNLTMREVDEEKTALKAQLAAANERAAERNAKRAEVAEAERDALRAALVEARAALKSIAEGNTETYGDGRQICVWCDEGARSGKDINHDSDLCPCAIARAALARLDTVGGGEGR